MHIICNLDNILSANLFDQRNRNERTNSKHTHALACTPRSNKLSVTKQQHPKLLNELDSQTHCNYFSYTPTVYSTKSFATCLQLLSITIETHFKVCALKLQIFRFATELKGKKMKGNENCVSYEFMLDVCFGKICHTIYQWCSAFVRETSTETCGKSYILEILRVKDFGAIPIKR